MTTLARLRGSGTLPVKLVACAVVAALLFVILDNTMQNRGGYSTRTYQAMFDEVSGLRANDDVRIAGVKVGRVTGIRIVGPDAEVSFEVDRSQRVSDRSTMVMRYQNLLGQRYLAIDQAETGGRVLPEGALIPLSRTSPGFDLTALLNGFRPLFDALRPDDINRLSQSIIKVLQGEGGTVAQLLTQTAELSDFLADRDEIFSAVVRNLTPVVEELAGEGGDVRRTVDSLDNLVTALADRRQDFGAAVDGIASTLTETSALVAQMRAPIAADIAKLRTVATMFASQGKAFGASIVAFAELVEILGRITSYRSAVNFYVCDLTFGLAGSWLDLGESTGGTYSEVCR